MELLKIMYYDAAVGVKGQKRISGSFAIRFDLGSSYCTQHLRPACRLEVERICTEFRHTDWQWVRAIAIANATDVGLIVETQCLEDLPL